MRHLSTCIPFGLLGTRIERSSRGTLVMSTLRSEGTKEDDDDDEQMSSVENVKTVENFYAVILVLGPIILLV